MQPIRVSDVQKNTFAGSFLPPLTLPLAQQSHQPTHTASQPSISSVNGTREIPPRRTIAGQLRSRRTGKTGGRLEAAPRIIFLIQQQAERTPCQPRLLVGGG